MRDSSVSVPYADYTIMPSFRPQQNNCDTNGLSARMNGNRPIPPPGVVTQTAHFSPRECVSPRSVQPAAGRCFFQTPKSSRPTLQESSTARSLSPYLPSNHPTISGFGITATVISYCTTSPLPHCPLPQPAYIYAESTPSAMTSDTDTLPESPAKEPAHRVRLRSQAEALRQREWQYTDTVLSESVLHRLPCRIVKPGQYRKRENRKCGNQNGDEYQNDEKCHGHIRRIMTFSQVFRWCLPCRMWRPP